MEELGIDILFFMHFILTFILTLLFLVLISVLVPIRYERKIYNKKKHSSFLTLIIISIAIVGFFITETILSLIGESGRLFMTVIFVSWAILILSLFIFFLIKFWSLVNKKFAMLSLILGFIATVIVLIQKMMGFPLMLYYTLFVFLATMSLYFFIIKFIIDNKFK